MDFARDLLLVLHIVGLASIIGGFLVQTRSSRKRVEPAMLHGALTALVTGVLLVGVAEMGDVDLNHVKIGVKLVVALVIAVLAWRGRKASSVSTGVWGAIGGLALLNVVLAVFW
ncbi:hypothetical protein [Actinotalea sp. Marseille-Q4924]|uniref:hypothetical protein n=1 Tax=Actinotalea sp. Marseille-Q4924 TaxID=2866571 RepID=UPI001CE41AD7|nr:hypothetical protein [Actinotalea sp. Marseille-Q4924]